ncbi:MAG: hypothetical protein SFX19_01000 [Alphaproteobacteria bacterium]|nr:hypothetical protein [Alphaproteobacteria bacterium]
MMACCARPSIALLCKGLLLVEAVALLALLSPASVSFPYGHMLALLVYVLVAYVPVIFVCSWLRRQSVGMVSLCFFVLAALVSLHYIYISNDSAYTNDMPGHLARVQFITDHWLAPYEYKGWQQHHPPLYYHLAAAVYWLTDQFFVAVNPLTSLRFFSWMCYLLFNAYSLLTLRRAGFSGIIYYSSLALLLLWPAGFHVASKISPEPLYYALYAASFYHALCWYQEGRQGVLRRAVVLAGLALTVRTGAVVLCAVIAALVLIRLFQRRVYIRDFLSKYWLAVWAILALCLAINMGRIILYGYPLSEHLVSFKRTPFPLSHYLSLHFDYTLTHPFNDFTHNQSFWDFFLKTAIFGEYRWTSPQLASALIFVAMLVVFYTALPWLFARRAEWRELLPYLLGALIPLLFLIVFSVRAPHFSTQDARFVYPSLVCFTVFFGKSQEFYQARRALALRVLGPLLAGFFTILAIIFFWCNAR